MLKVEVVYALAQRTVCKIIEVTADATVGEALKLAAADPSFRGLDLSQAPVGIYGKVASRDQLLKAGDRIEIYRPLLEDAKLARRKRANPKSSKSGRS